MRMIRSMWIPALLGLVVGLLAYAPVATSLRAQSRTVDTDMRQAAADIAELEAAYATIRGYALGTRTTVTEAKQAAATINEKLAALNAKTPSLHMLAIHEQIRFAAERCSNFANLANMGESERSSPFSVIVAINEREHCIVQIHAAKLRLIEYGQSKGVNPFR